MFRFLSHLFASDSVSGRASGHARKARLGCEAFEDRCTPGGGIWTDDGSYTISPTTSLSTTVSTYDAVSLNPQPLPPRW